MTFVRFCLVAAVTALVLPGSVARGADQSVQGQILVVTTNLQEAFDRDDADDPSDMRVYVSRLLKQLPYAPDVVLVQEVRRSSARNVAGLLTQASGYRYSIVVPPGEPPWRELDDRIIDRESAVIVNEDTVEVLGATGTIKSVYPGSVARAGEPRRVRNHAFASVALLDRSASITVASVHYVQNDFLTSPDVGDDYKRRWALQTADFLAAQAAEWGTSMTAIGGDFNASRGRRDDYANHSHSPWLVGLTGDGYGYRDTVYEVTKEGGPDFIMAAATIVNAGVDMYYNARRAARDGYFYSDHRFRWAIISPE